MDGVEHHFGRESAGAGVAGPEPEAAGAAQPPAAPPPPPQAAAAAAAAAAETAAGAAASPQSPPATPVSTPQGDPAASHQNAHQVERSRQKRRESELYFADLLRGPEGAMLLQPCPFPLQEGAPFEVRPQVVLRLTRAYGDLQHAAYLRRKVDSGGSEAAIAAAERRLVGAWVVVLKVFQPAVLRREKSGDANTERILKRIRLWDTGDYKLGFELGPEKPPPKYDPSENEEAKFRRAHAAGVQARLSRGLAVFVSPPVAAPDAASLRAMHKLNPPVFVPAECERVKQVHMRTAAIKAQQRAAPPLVIGELRKAAKAMPLAASTWTTAGLIRMMAKGGSQAVNLLRWVCEEIVMGRVPPEVVPLLNDSKLIGLSKQSQCALSVQQLQKEASEAAGVSYVVGQRVERVAVSGAQSEAAVLAGEAATAGGAPASGWGVVKAVFMECMAEATVRDAVDHVGPFQGDKVCTLVPGSRHRVLERCVSSKTGQQRVRILPGWVSVTASDGTVLMAERLKVAWGAAQRLAEVGCAAVQPACACAWAEEDPMEPAVGPPPQVSEAAKQRGGDATVLPHPSLACPCDACKAAPPDPTDCSSKEVRPIATGDIYERLAESWVSKCFKKQLADALMEHSAQLGVGVAGGCNAVAAMVESSLRADGKQRAMDRDIRNMFNSICRVSLAEFLLDSGNSPHADSPGIGVDLAWLAPWFSQAYAPSTGWFWVAGAAGGSGAEGARGRWEGVPSVRGVKQGGPMSCALAAGAMVMPLLKSRQAMEHHEKVCGSACPLCDPVCGLCSGGGGSGGDGGESDCGGCGGGGGGGGWGSAGGGGGAGGDSGSGSGSGSGGGAASAPSPPVLSSSAPQSLSAVMSAAQLAAQSVSAVLSAAQSLDADEGACQVGADASVGAAAGGARAGGGVVRHSGTQPPATPQAGVAPDGASGAAAPGGPPADGLGARVRAPVAAAAAAAAGRVRASIRERIQARQRAAQQCEQAAFLDDATSVAGLTTSGVGYAAYVVGCAQNGMACVPYKSSLGGRWYEGGGASPCVSATDGQQQANDSNPTLRSGEYSNVEDQPELAREVELLPGVRVLHAKEGRVTLGVPIGTPEYVATEVENQVRKHDAQLRGIVAFSEWEGDQERTVGGNGRKPTVAAQLALHMLRFCANARSVHFLRGLGRKAVRRGAELHDNGVRVCLAMVLRQVEPARPGEKEPATLAAMPEERLLPEFRLAYPLMGLARSEGGLAVRPWHAHADAAHVGMWVQALQATQVKVGQTTTGHFPSLVNVHQMAAQVVEHRRAQQQDPQAVRGGPAISLAQMPQVEALAQAWERSCETAEEAYTESERADPDSGGHWLVATEGRLSELSAMPRGMQRNLSQGVKQVVRRGVLKALRADRSLGCARRLQRHLEESHSFAGDAYAGVPWQECGGLHLSNEAVRHMCWLRYRLRMPASRLPPRKCICGWKGHSTHGTERGTLDCAPDTELEHEWVSTRLCAPSGVSSGPRRTTRWCGCGWRC